MTNFSNIHIEIYMKRESVFVIQIDKSFLIGLANSPRLLMKCGGGADQTFNDY
jgi:hypothetical protein